MNPIRKLKLQLLAWLANWMLNQLTSESLEEKPKRKNGETHLTMTEDFIEERNSEGVIIRLYVRKTGGMIDSDSSIVQVMNAYERLNRSSELALRDVRLLQELMHTTNHFEETETTR